ncbi:LacI family DNA-binding transcriptional regulator [Novosphingobium profundi]|nr:LacI family DNA-binding transcriptional regulator [Novosphingobium profundi]
MAASTDDAPSSLPPEPATPPPAAGLDCAESPPSQARQTPRPGAPLTIAEIADLAGVSTKTVSRYLNQSPLLSDTMRGRIEEVIARTGFVPNAQARALALRRNFLVALIQDGRAGEIAQAVEAGMLEAMKESELALVLHRLDTAPAERDANLRTFLLRHHPCGVVLLPPLSEEEAIARCCAQAGTTAIRLGKVPGNAGLAADDRAAMASLVHWLVASGHTRIALVGGPESSLSARERELGYLDAMADHGLDRGPALIEPGDNSLASGLAAGRVLLELSPRPSAIIACNDAMAAGLLQAASEAAVPVPDTLSVIGFDDTPLATMTCPPLTSVHVPWRALGAEAIRQIRESFTPPSVAVSDPAPAFEARLVERGSVQALTRALVSDAGLEGKSARRTSGFDHASSPFAPAIETFAALPKFPE